MTIKMYGHVESLSTGSHPVVVKLKICVEASRMVDELIVEAMKGEADIYRPGTQVEITIIPMPPRS